MFNNSSLNRSASNLQDNITGQPFSTSSSAQSGAPSPVYQRSGSVQGFHYIRGSFNLPNMQGPLGSRNVTMGNVPSSGLQQPSGNLSSGRFTSNIPDARSQISHGNSYGHPGLADRGGMSAVGNPGFCSGTVGDFIPGMPLTSAATGNRNAISGVGVSPALGNLSPRNTNSDGNIIGGGNIGRSINTGGGLSGFSSRHDLNTNNGSGNVGLQGSNRLMGDMFQQASPQVMSMYGNSHHSGGPLSQNVNSIHPIAMMNDLNNDDSLFDINDFPHLGSRPSSSSRPQGQIGSLRKQGLGVSPIVHQNQEFSIQNEDFPTLPGLKSGTSEFGMDLHQKEQLHENNIPMVQSPHISMGRSSGFNLRGTFSSHRPQQQSNNVPFSKAINQDPQYFHGSDMFQGSHTSHHSQANGLAGVGLRPPNSQNPISGISSFDQFNQQHYPPQQNQSQFRPQQMSGTGQTYRKHGMKSTPTGQTAQDRFGLLGLLSVIKMSDPDLTSLALGIDLTTLGLNLNSAENLNKTFGSPWLDEPIKGDPVFTVPECYYAKQPPKLNSQYFAKVQLNTLFYIFYSMPKEEAQMYAGNELRNRGWFYHKELHMWLMRAPKVDLLRTNAYEQESYICFDPNTWTTIRKDNFMVNYEALDAIPPPVPQRH